MSQAGTGDLALSRDGLKDLSQVGRAGLQLLREIHNLTSGGRTLVLMRHSARHYGQAENDLDNPLSEEGRDLSRMFGRELPRWNRLRLATSPSGRCVETADLIGRGFGSDVPTRVMHDLAVFYVKDMRRVGGMLKHLGVDETLERWFTGTVDPAWMDPASVSVGRLLNCLRGLYDEGGADELTLCVSHDWNLYLLAHHALGTCYREQPKAEYLDCVAFYEGEAGLVVADRHGGHRPFDFSLG